MIEIYKIWGFASEIKNTSFIFVSFFIISGYLEDQAYLTKAQGFYWI